MKNLLRSINDWANHLLSALQNVFQSPLWFFGTIIITIAWMLAMLISKNPIDSPKAGFPDTILYYTLMSLWIENAVKVAQSIQSKMQQEQMNRLEFVLRSVQEQTERANERDKVIHHLISVTNRLAQTLYDRLADKDSHE